MKNISPVYSFIHYLIKIDFYISENCKIENTEEKWNMDSEGAYEPFYVFKCF
jgi:hypothetical protein